MREINDIVGDAILKFEKIKLDNEIVNQIIIIIDTLDDRKIEMWTGDELSRSGLQLSLLLVNLGEMVSSAELQANTAYIYRKWKGITEYKRLRQEFKTIKDTDNATEEAISQEYEKQLEARYNADMLKSFYKSVNGVIMAIQSRLKQLQSEQINSNKNMD